MTKYRKKPVLIEAWIWDESKETFDKIGCEFSGYSGKKNNLLLMFNLRIKINNGSMRVDRGDYIIKDEKGEFSVCKPDIFKSTYDEDL